MIFSFADLEVDEGLYQLRSRGKVVKLAPKAFDLLLYLICHRDRVVSKAELLDQLWPGEHVTESVLPSNVAAVRKALQSRRSRSELIDGLLERIAFIGPISLAFAAFLHSELDESEPARLHFERLAAKGFADVPRNEAWLMTLAVAAEACAYLGDRPRARILYDLLLPYADLTVSQQHMRVYLGSMEYVLGRLAETREEREWAAARYERAMESSHQIGARPHLARTEFAYARMLLETDPASSQLGGVARELLARAEATARELGMARLLELAHKLQRGRC